MNKMLQLLRRPLARLLLLLAACWVLVLLGPLSCLVIPVVVVALVRAGRQRAWLALALLLLLNPVSGIFAGGIAAYLGGAPSLRARELPTLDSSNPDPDNRCFRAVGPCLWFGNAWIINTTHNAAVLLMCRCFGPPADAYAGPYPTKAEALVAMKGTLLTPVDQFLKGRALADGAMVKLEPAVVKGLAGLVGLKDDETTPVRARLYQDRCVIFRFSQLQNPADKAAGFGADVLVLVDKLNQRPFAYYQITGDTLPSVPPVAYLNP